MAFKEDFNLFVGAKFGVFKALKVTAGQPVINKSIQSLQHLSNSTDVTAMAWSDEDEVEILLGLSNQIVKVYDTNYKAFVTSTDVGYTTDNGVNTSGSICGLSRYDGALLTAVESGHIRLWMYENGGAMELYAGGPISRMRHSTLNSNIIGTGGLENELKLWDLTSGKTIFTAKNVPHDFLQLRVKCWVSDLSFMADSDKVIVGSRYGYVRMYDPKAQRRPVLNVELPDKSVCCLANCVRDQTVLCGLAKGDIQAIDLRMGRPARKYGGFVGAVRDIACHPEEPYIVSVSLDRFVRVHDLLSKKLLFKEFIVSRANCLLMRSNFTYKSPLINSKKKMKTSPESPVDMDEALEKLEQIVDGQKSESSKKRITASKFDTPVSKKKKTSTFINPFAAVDPVHKTPQDPKISCEGEEGSGSDDDIQILSESLQQQSSNSESEADEAEGSSSDLGSDEESLEGGPSFQQSKNSLSNPFYCSEKL